MKIKHLFYLLVFLFLSFPAVADPGRKNLHAWVDSPDGLMMRSGPGADSTRLYALPYGTKVEILETNTTINTIDNRSGRWSKVRVKQLGQYTGGGISNEGWVFGGFLTDNRIGFRGMHLPPFARLWNLNENGIDALYNNEEKSEIVDYIRKNHANIEQALPITNRQVTLNKALENLLKKRAKKYGMGRIDSVKAWEVLSGGLLIIVDGFASLHDSDSGNTSYVAFKSHDRELPDDVITFPSHEYNGPVHVYIKGEYQTKFGNAVLLHFGINDQSSPDAKSFLTLMNNYPHLYFHEIVSEDSE